MFYRPHKRRHAAHSDEVVTKQSHKAECDIHNILRQYQRTGILQHVARVAPVFEDLPDHTEFQTAMNQVLQAQEAFAALPARVRDRYGNDPGRLLAAMQDPEQIPELRALGILKALEADPAAPATPPAADAT